MTIPLPKSKPLQFGLFFITQFISYFLLVANYRAVSAGGYIWTGITDTLIGAQNFGLSMALIDNKEARGYASWIGYSAGGTCGSLASIFVTKHLYGKYSLY